MKYMSYLFLLFGLLLASCSSSSDEQKEGEPGGNSVLELPEGGQKVVFRGLYADEQPEGIYNPERGFRLVTSIDAQGHHYVFDWEGKTTLTSQLMEQHEKWQKDSVSLVTSYFYLHRYQERDLDDRAFAAVSNYLKQVRKLGKKVLLRFAYEISYEEAVKSGPTEERILRHIQQLKPLVKVNKDVIYLVQAGFVGCWGEWHDSHHQLEKNESVAANLLTHIVDMVPDGRYVQIRYPQFKELLKGNPAKYSRIGIHDDFVILDSSSSGTADMHEGGKWFPYIVEQSYEVPVDGEMPPFNDWKQVIDGNRMARQLFLQHYSSLSCVNSYEESICKWKETSIDRSMLEREHMPVSDLYFQRKDGTSTARSAFDYIRDHLGYRLELQELDLKKTSSQELMLSLKVINRGFAKVCNSRPAYFVLVDAQGKVYPFATSANLNTFYPYVKGDKLRRPVAHFIQAHVNVSQLPKGSYRVGLWLPDESSKLQQNRRYAIRCANGGNLKWWISADECYGVNLCEDAVVKIK